MKKLLTLLICMVIVSITYAVDNTWQGGSSGDWQVVSNWSAGHIPSSAENIIFDIGGTVNVYNVPDAGLDNMFISKNTYVTLRTGLISTPQNDGKTLTFTTLSQAGHNADVEIEYGSSLNCNVTNERVQIVCNPGTRFRIGSYDEGSGYINGHFYPALYSPCDFEKGFVLKAGKNAQDIDSHAELVQQNNSGDAVRGWIEYDFTGKLNTWHEVSVPIIHDPSLITGNAWNICRASNCLCAFSGNYLRKFINGSAGTNGKWDVLMENYPDCSVSPLDVEIGRGYETWSLLPKTYMFGTFNNAPFNGTNGGPGSITFPMQAGETGWNFLGNPFPSGIKFTANSGSSPLGWVWNKNKVEPWVCYYDNSLPGYRYYNIDNASLSVPPTTTDIIPRGQGFFVHVNDNTFTPLKVDNQARNFNTDISIAKSSAVTMNNIMHLTLSSNGGYNDDVAIAMTDENATPNYDLRGDFLKLFLNVTERSELYCKTADNLDVVINYLKPVNGTITVPVYLNVGPAGNYTLNLSYNSYASGTSIILRDTKTNLAVDLKATPDYNFYAEVGDAPGRFIVTFKDVLFGVNNLNTIDFDIYSFENMICVQNNTAKNINGTITVYDMLGRQLLEQNVGSDLITRINTNLNRGFYIVTVRTGNGVCSQKVYIK